ncbi:hypothetical protein D3C83_46460 [compost metagenome]
MAGHHLSQFLQRVEAEPPSSECPNRQKVSVLPRRQSNGFHVRPQLSESGREIQREDLRPPPIAVGDQLQNVHVRAAW